MCVPHSSLSGRALTEQQQGEAGREHAVPTADMRPASQSVLRGEGRTHQDPELTDMSPGQVGPDSCRTETHPEEGERRRNRGGRDSVGRLGMFRFLPERFGGSTF